MKYLFFIAFALFLTACDKKNPTPELQDEIYKDLVQELDIASKVAEDQEKAIASLKKDQQTAVPQTGQVKYATKKVYDAEAKLEVMKQHKQFFEIKIELRKHEVRQRYEESLKEGGRPWPDPQEVATYKAVTKLQRDKIQYEKNGGKVVPRGTDQKPAAAEPAPSH